ncbi:hypothetical protein ABVK25_006734 [Lepraria finkii]|uniref:Uncharacterized protein n=1 Tax=Lepraria finkii TaxID=1340010 RepID=A0ABR4B5F1_9LECA
MFGVAMAEFRVRIEANYVRETGEVKVVREDGHAKVVGDGVNGVDEMDDGDEGGW